MPSLHDEIIGLLPSEFRTHSFGASDGVKRLVTAYEAIIRENHALRHGIDVSQPSGLRGEVMPVDEIPLDSGTGESPLTSGCECMACRRERAIGCTAPSMEFRTMVLCDLCGNKRCPHASDHRNACTNSNNPGQAGSIFSSPAAKPFELPTEMEREAEMIAEAWARDDLGAFDIPEGAEE